MTHLSSRALRRYTGADEAEVDMTPMLDIVFIMLIFFIVTATFLDESGIDLTEPPPHETHITTPDTKAVEIYVDNKGMSSIAGESLEPANIADRVEKLMADGVVKSVILRSAAEADLDVVVTIKDSLDLRAVPNVLKIDRQMNL